MVHGKFFGSFHLAAPLKTKTCGTFLAFMYFCCALAALSIAPSSIAPRAVVVLKLNLACIIVLPDGWNRGFPPSDADRIADGPMQPEYAPVRQRCQGCLARIFFRLSEYVPLAAASGSQAGRA